MSEIQHNYNPTTEGGVHTDETDFPAEQPLEKADSWLPRAHEDEGRPSRSEEKTPAR